MSPLRYRDDESISTGTVVGVLVGAVAGFAAGMFVAQRMGGFAGLRSRFRRGAKDDELEPTRNANAGALDIDEDDLEDYDTDELDEDGDEALEERVLEAYRNDPLLAERAVDIGAIGEGVIELAGWVRTEEEAEHAVTIARGVPGVDTVLNRLAVGTEEDRIADAARRFADGDPAFTETHWDSNTIGTGRRRQGTSEEPDRHADPRVPLEERWSSEREAERNAAEDIGGIAERRHRRAGRGAGVPRADHVGDPLDRGGADTP